MGKLVRDKVINEIRDSGKEPIYHVLTDEEYKEEVYRKLQEEVDELCRGRNSEEMADVIEALTAIYHSDPETYNEVEIKAVRKRKEKGSFYGKIFLDEVR